ncbi:MAG TPA: TetR/AcrR family transcriptional regulator [Pseudoduganella sp.]
MSASFDFKQFQATTPLDGTTIWTWLFTRNAQRITVKRARPALENLEKIFAATFRLANEVGFRAMTLRDLCRETGLSMGGLYGYISTKDQLAEMIEDVVRHASGAVPEWYAHVEDPLERLEAMVRGWIYLSELLQPWFYFVYMDSRALKPEQRATAKESELNVQAVLADTIRQAAPERPCNPELLAAHCLAAFQDWYVKRWKYRSSKIDVDEFAASVVAVVRNGLS